MAGSDSEIDKPQCGRPERAELPDVNINTGAQSINTAEKASLRSLETLRATGSALGRINSRNRFGNSH